MNYESFLENFASNVAAAIAIAILALGFNWLGNFVRERRLMRKISLNGVGTGFSNYTHEASFNVQIHNYADAAIRILSVVMIAERFHVQLLPDSDGHMYQTPLLNEVLQKKFKRKYLSKVLLEPDGNPHSVLLPAKTMAMWRADPDEIGKFEWVITKVYVVFEYATLLGNSAIVRMSVEGSDFKLIKESFERLAKSAHSKTPYDFDYHLREKPAA